MMATRRLIAIIVVGATVALLIALTFIGKPRVTPSGSVMAAFTQTYVALKPEAPLQIPPLVTSTGVPFAAKQLQGHWSLLFFGFTACPLVCPKTMSILSAINRYSDAGAAAGVIQSVFVSVDPEHDTPQQVAIYLRHFDNKIIGLTGSRDAISSLGREIGAGYQPVGSAIDHSTSLFVVDPKGRLAGIILRPDHPTRILADLAKIRLSEADLHEN